MKKILFVDDDQLTLNIGKMMLSAIGYDNIVMAEGGQEAIDILEKESDFAVILLDLMMPDVYGLDVLKYIKSNANTRFIPVVVQTGVQGSADIKKAMELGASAILRKPYNKVILKDELDRLLADN